MALDGVPLTMLTIPAEFLLKKILVHVCLDRSKYNSIHQIKIQGDHKMHILPLKTFEGL